MLVDMFPEAAHVRLSKLERASDDDIWEFARRENFAIVTLDSDFADIAALRGAPPKIIWLRCGNQPAIVVEQLMRDHADVIARFAESEDLACLELY
jgi:predicted nuclease of predicted toxin-antitoxin system